jgi:Kef-type K+ transport system membrane component KefB
VRFTNAVQVGLLVCQAGEFSFVMVGIATEDDKQQFLRDMGVKFIATNLDIMQFETGINKL